MAERRQGDALAVSRICIQCEAVVEAAEDAERPVSPLLRLHLQLVVAVDRLPDPAAAEGGSGGEELGHDLLG